MSHGEFKAHLFLSTQSRFANFLQKMLKMENQGRFGEREGISGMPYKVGTSRSMRNR